MTVVGDAPPAPDPPAASASESPDDETGEAADQPGGRRTALRTALLVAGLVAVSGGIPLAVALGVLRQPQWYPALDLAQTELRVRDVGTGHRPSVGLAGRFYAFGERGSHPGPLSFWALWPVYKVLGSTAWGLQAATAALNLVAMSLAVWMAHRRGGARLALVAAVGLAVLAQAYTAERLTGPWNPYLPVLWWMVFLLAVWSVLDDDIPMLPVAVFAGSFCAQTHIPYLGLVGGVGLATVGVLGWRSVRRWRSPNPPDDGPTGPTGTTGRRKLRLAWAGGGLVLLLVLWIPPLVEQFTNDLGNLGLLRESFTHPREAGVAFTTALDAWLAHLNPWGLWHVDGALDISRAPMGSPVPGLLLLTAWLLAAGVAWRQRRERPTLVRLHLVVALASGLGLMAASRINGELWDYLMLWAWGTTVLMVLAVLLTLGPPVAARARAGRASRWWTERRQVALLSGALAAVTVVFAVEAAGSKPLNGAEAATVAQVAPDVVTALRQGERSDGTPVPGDGARGRYLLRWHENELATPGEGFGLLLELERQGLDVGGPASDAEAIVPHRVRRIEDATATVNVVAGETNVARWRQVPGAVQVAAVDLRTPAQRERYATLRDEVAADLRAAGLDELARGLYVNVLATLFDERMPPRIERKADVLLDLGAPMAIFVAPPDAG